MTSHNPPAYVREPLFKDSAVTGSGQPYPWPKATQETAQAVELERLRQSLPLHDPDRHALDTVADQRFAALAARYEAAA